MASRCAAGAARRSCGSPSREDLRRILLSSWASGESFTGSQPKYSWPAATSSARSPAPFWIVFAMRRPIAIEWSMLL